MLKITCVGIFVIFGLIAIQAQQYEFVFQKITVAKTKADGKDWDSGFGDHSPDIQITFSQKVGNRFEPKFQTKKWPNCLEHTETIPTKIKVDAYTELKIEVTDIDLQSHDQVGVQILQFNKEGDLQDSAVKTIQFGRVTYFEYSLKKSEQDKIKELQELEQSLHALEQKLKQREFELEQNVEKLETKEQEITQKEKELSQKESEFIQKIAELQKFQAENDVRKEYEISKANEQRLTMAIEELSRKLKEAFEERNALEVKLEESAKNQQEAEAKLQEAMKKQEKMEAQFQETLAKELSDELVAETLKEVENAEQKLQLAEEKLQAAIEKLQTAEQKEIENKQKEEELRQREEALKTADENGFDEPFDEPTTDEPTTDEPTTDEPTTDEPTTDEPTTDEPTTDEPTGEKDPLIEEQVSSADLEDIEEIQGEPEEPVVVSPSKEEMKAMIRKEIEEAITEGRGLFYKELERDPDIREILFIYRQMTGGNEEENIEDTENFDEK